MTLDLGPYADCVDAAALTEGLTARLGAAAVPHVQVAFRPAEPPLLEVALDGEVVWARPFDIADCAAAHEVIALSVQRGVEGLPTLPWDAAPEPERGPWLLGAFLTGSAGTDTPEPRVGLRLLAGREVGRTSFLLVARGAQGSWFPVGDGEARLTTASGGLGVQGGWGVARLGAEVGAGVGSAAGRGFPTDLSGAAPRLTAAGSAGLGRGPWEAALEVDVVLLGVVAEEPLHGAAVAESAVRLGLRVGAVARP
jgi:hypothetical protein